MRDISDKTKTARIAAAQATLKVSPATIKLISEGKIPKGDPLAVAKIAAISAAKNTSQIIPYCHTLPIDFVGVEFSLSTNAITVTTTVKAVYKTGVEMEALTAASVAVLTAYDMMKMLDGGMEITGVKLLSKKGGKADFKQEYKKPLRTAVLVMSDSVAAGRASDVSGKLIVEQLQELGVELVEYKVVPDELETIEAALLKFSDKLKVDLVITTGGTGVSPRDCTPEAMSRIIEREVPGISEAVRAYGQEHTPFSMLSRAMAGLRGKTLIVNLPGSRSGVADALNVLLPALLHSFHVLSLGGHDSSSTLRH